MTFSPDVGDRAACFSAISRRRAWRLAAALTLAYPLLHKSASDLCDWTNGQWGFTVYNRTALIAIPLVSIVAVSFVVGPRPGRLLRPFTLASVLALVAISLAAQRWLLVVNIELIHLPQFALVAAVLLAGGMSGPAAYLGATAVGIVDETYQHLVIYAGRPETYFDVNDIVLNAIGACWGVVLLGGVFCPSDVGGSSIVATNAGLRRSVTMTRAAVVVVLTVSVALWLDPPHGRPLLQGTPSGHTMYRVLSTAEGSVICAALWFLIELVWRRELRKTDDV